MLYNLVTTRLAFLIFILSCDSAIGTNGQQVNSGCNSVSVIRSSMINMSFATKNVCLTALLMDIHHFSWINIISL